MKPVVDSSVSSEKSPRKPLVIKLSQQVSTREPMPCTWIVW